MTEAVSRAVGAERAKLSSRAALASVVLAVVLLGVMSLRSLWLEQSPPVNTPIVTVQVIYRGASSLGIRRLCALCQLGRANGAR